MLAAPLVGAFLASLPSAGAIAARAAPVAIAAAEIAARLPDVREMHAPYIEDYATNALSVAEPDAIVFGSEDERTGAFLYARYALGARRDVVYVTAPLLLARWYRARIKHLVGVSLVTPSGDAIDVRAMLATALGTGRSVYFCK